MVGKSELSLWLVVKKGHSEDARYLCVKKTKMYSSEELEKFYFDYQTKWMPRGMSIQAYCSRNNVPYKTSTGMRVSRGGLDYGSLRMFIEKLEGVLY